MVIAHFRRRRGSVLILVVALLVLMALIGTAFIVTARTDRIAARLHAHNVQADMAVQSAVNMVTAELSADLFGPSGSQQFSFMRDYRPPSYEGGEVPPFENFDGFGDSIFSPRVPVLLHPGKPPTPLYPETPPTSLFPFDLNGVNPPVWMTVSGWPPLPLNLLPPWMSDETLPRGRRIFAPTARRLLGHDLWPHLQLYVDGKPWDSNPDTPEIDPLPAADADGDGIADSVLWKLPMGPMNGVTYYAAIRVIDNNSAINVNTALSRDFDFNGNLNAVVAPSYFTGRVGLAEMLRSYNPNGSSIGTIGAEFEALNRYRCNSGTGPLIAAGVRGSRFPIPFDDLGNPRPDFNFLSFADALQSQLGRRIGNPGNSVGPLKWRAFTLSDSMALGYRFCLVDPTSSPSALERVMWKSLVESVPTTPYRADETVRWMERFLYDNQLPERSETFRDLRALLVARNPVANQAPARYAANDVDGDGDRNDLPTDVATQSSTRFVGGTILAEPNAVRPYEGMRPFYRRRPGGDRVRATPPVPINSAPFPELWRGFWSVMTPDYYNSSANSAVQIAFWVPSHQSVYYGSRFKPPTSADLTPDNPADPPPVDSDPMDVSAFAAKEEVHPHLMFRSSIRDPELNVEDTPVRITPASQLLLRAALAAVNTEDLRDADDDVSSHLIELRVFPGRLWPENGDEFEEKVPVRVYGTERQPYLTEVYVNTDDRPTADGKPGNPKGYVAIELHNPYSVDIHLDGPGGPGSNNGWSIGLIDRRGIRSPPPPAPPNRTLFIKNLNGSTDRPWRFPMGTVIPAKGYLVLENYDAGGDQNNSAASGGLQARRRPQAAAATLEPTEPALVNFRRVYVPELHRLLFDPSDPAATGGEFVLLRTRLASGQSTVNLATDTLDERKNLRDLVPVDQFDFTGASLTPTPGTGAGPYTVLHYVRANGPAAPWRFVYPGRYDGELRAQRHQGTVQVDFGPGLGRTTDPFNPLEPDPLAARLPGVRLGAADPAAHPNQGRFPIQIAAPGFGGPNPPRSGGGNAYPFGLFARAGDMLQIPFIGAYTVYAHPRSSIPSQAAQTPSRPPEPANATEIYEMNSLSMDSVFAEDSDTTDDPGPGANPLGQSQLEQVGRFCPVRVWRPDLSRAPRVDDFTAPASIRKQPGSPNSPEFGYPNFGGWSPPPNKSYDPRNLPPIGQGTYRYRYRWAMDLFDQFCLQAPHNDFLPNIAPSLYKTAAGQPVRPLPVPVSNSGGVAGNSDDNDPSNHYVEDTQPVEGLVNINTAPWKVLASLPMVLNDDGSVNAKLNAELAKAIVYYRDVDGSGPRDKDLNPHGPFKNIFELNAVIDTRPDSLREIKSANLGFRNGYGTITPAGREPGLLAGDLSPGIAGATDGVRGDFEENWLVLNRISNLITTRSDSFTCYVYVMGVTNDGAPDAQIKVQRRVAFIADRSAVRPLRPVVRTMFFNNE